MFYFVWRLPQCIFLTLMQCVEDRWLTSINFCARVNCSTEKQVVSYVTFWKDSGYVKGGKGISALPHPIPYVACLCLGEVSTKKGAKTRKFLICELCSYRLSHTGAVEAPRKKKTIISFTTWWKYKAVLMEGNHKIPRCWLFCPSRAFSSHIWQ